MTLNQFLPKTGLSQRDARVAKKIFSKSGSNSLKDWDNAFKKAGIYNETPMQVKEESAPMIKKKVEATTETPKGN